MISCMCKSSPLYCRHRKSRHKLGESGDVTICWKAGGESMNAHCSPEGRRMSTKGLADLVLTSHPSIQHLLQEYPDVCSLPSFTLSLIFTPRS